MVFPTSGYGGIISVAGSSTKTPINKLLALKKFLDKPEESRAIFNLAQQKLITVPKFAGDTIEMTRILPLDALTSALSEGTAASDQDFAFSTQRAILEEWGGFVKVSSRYNYATWDDNNAELWGILKDQANDTLELRARKAFTTKSSTLMRVDNDKDYEAHDVVVSAASSTTVFLAATLPGLTSSYDFSAAPALVTITKGPGYGEQRTVSAYNNSTGQITVSAAFATAPTADSRFSIATTTTLTASDTISFSAFGRAKRQLGLHKAKAIGGYMRALLTDYTKADFMEDTRFEKLAIYHTTGKDAYFKGEVFDAMGIRFTVVTPAVSYFCAADVPATRGDAGSSYPVEIIPILGANCFGEVKTTQSSIDVWETSPEEAEKASRMYGYLSWKHMGIDCPLNACWGIGLATGYTL